MLVTKSNSTNNKKLFRRARQVRRFLEKTFAFSSPPQSTFSTFSTFSKSLSLSLLHFRTIYDIRFETHNYTCAIEQDKIWHKCVSSPQHFQISLFLSPSTSFTETWKTDGSFEHVQSRFRGVSCGDHRDGEAFGSRWEVLGMWGVVQSGSGTQSYPHDSHLDRFGTFTSPSLSHSLAHQHYKTITAQGLTVPSQPQHQQHHGHLCSLHIDKSEVSGRLEQRVEFVSWSLWIELSRDIETVSQQTHKVEFESTGHDRNPWRLGESSRDLTLTSTQTFVASLCKGQRSSKSSSLDIHIDTTSGGARVG